MVERLPVVAATTAFLRLRPLCCHKLNQRSAINNMSWV